MKVISLLTLLIIFLSLKLTISENCQMQIHSFFLLPLNKESEIKEIGLDKYNYMLILKTVPKGTDHYHLILNVTFPVKINIDLSNEIIYTFISLEKFCLLDLTKEKGRYVNILGTISDSVSKNKILERIHIKVENVLLFRNVGENKQANFYLLTDYNESDKADKKYFLMKQMYDGINQNFQIANCFISKKQKTLNYECKNNADLKGENILSLGDEISILNFDDKLRDDFAYSAFAKGYGFTISQVDNFICIKYQLFNYDELC